MGDVGAVLCAPPSLFLCAWGTEINTFPWSDMEPLEHDDPYGLCECPDCCGETDEDQFEPNM